MKKPSPETLRRLRRAGIGTGFGLLVFVVALYVWFPYDRAKEVAVSLAAAQNLDVEIESAGPAWGVGIADDPLCITNQRAGGGDAVEP